MDSTLVPAEMPSAVKAAARTLGLAGGAGVPQLLALLCNADADLAAVQAALHGEPALAARVLKVANSPYYGQSGHVGTIDRAMQLLGLTAIRGIAAAACLDRALPARTGQAFDPARFRRHSLAVACATQQLSRATAAGIDSEAFMAGLLHDIGILLLARADSAAMARFAPPEVVQADDGVRAERAHFGADHGDAAGALVDAWGLPPWLLAPLTGHHRPFGAADAADAAAAGLQRLPMLVALADHLATRAGFAMWPVCALPPDAAALAALGLDEAALQAVVDALPAQVRRMSVPS